MKVGSFYLTVKGILKPSSSFTPVSVILQRKPFENSNAL